MQDTNISVLTARLRTLENTINEILDDVKELQLIVSCHNDTINELCDKVGIDLPNDTDIDALFTPKSE